MSIKLVALYFVLGGTVVTLVTFFGKHDKGLLAAFVATLPSISVITLSTIYFSSGTQAAVSYFKGTLMIMPGWLLYVLATMYLLPRWGLLPSLITGVAIYLVYALAIMRLVR